MLPNHCSCITFEAGRRRWRRPSFHTFPNEICFDESRSYLAFDSRAILDRVHTRCTSQTPGGPMATLDLRPLSLGELLDRSFFLYRRHFILFAGISAIPYLIIVGATAGFVMLGRFAGAVPPISPNHLPNMGLAIGTIGGGFFVVI